MEDAIRSIDAWIAEKQNTQTWSELDAFEDWQNTYNPVEWTLVNEIDEQLDIEQGVDCLLKRQNLFLTPQFISFENKYSLFFPRLRSKHLQHFLSCILKSENSSNIKLSTIFSFLKNPNTKDIDILFRFLFVLLLNTKTPERAEEIKNTIHEIVNEWKREKHLKIAINYLANTLGLVPIPKKDACTPSTPTSDFYPWGNVALILQLLRENVNVLGQKSRKMALVYSLFMMVGLKDFGPVYVDVLLLIGALTRNITIAESKDVIVLVPKRGFPIFTLERLSRAQHTGILVFKKELGLHILKTQLRSFFPKKILHSNILVNDLIEHFLKLSNDIGNIKVLASYYLFSYLLEFILPETSPEASTLAPKIKNLYQLVPEKQNLYLQRIKSNLFKTYTHFCLVLDEEPAKNCMKFK